MGLFKINLIFLILVSFFFCSTNNQNKINELSILDYSPLSSHEFQFGFGYQNNNNIYMSVDKMISHNLIGSLKLFKFNSSNIELYNQNTLLFRSDKSSLNFIININYLIEHSNIDRWSNTGLIFDFIENNKFLSSLGIYYDFFSLEDLSNNKLNYFFSIKSRIKNSCSFMMGTSFNTLNKIINYNIEINLGI